MARRGLGDFAKESIFSWGPLVKNNNFRGPKIFQFKTFNPLLPFRTFIEPVCCIYDIIVSITKACHSLKIFPSRLVWRPQTRHWRPPKKLFPYQGTLYFFQFETSHERFIFSLFDLFHYRDIRINKRQGGPCSARGDFIHYNHHRRQPYIQRSHYYNCCIVGQTIVVE